MKRILTTSLLALVVTLDASAAKPEMARQLKAAQAQLAQLRGAYSDKHPKVQAQSQKVHELENQLKAAK